MTKAKLSVPDFYHQFHGHEHHNDAGDHINPRWFEIPKKHRKAHKGFDFHAHAATKGKRKVTVSKSLSSMRSAVRKHKAK